MARYRNLLSAASALALTAAFATTAVAEDQDTEGGDDGDRAEAEEERPDRTVEASAEVQAAAGVEEREPVDVSDTFDDGDRVFIWSRIMGAADSEVRHVWERNGAEIADISLEIGSESWRTWTRSQVASGDYAVRVVAEDGEELGSVSFTVD